MTLDKYLTDLEERIDSVTEEALWAQWETFAAGGFTGALFAPRRERRVAPNVDWPKVLTNEAIGDVDRMILQQLGACSRALAEGSGALLSVRCNYGSSILPSLFGVELFFMEDSQDTLPTSKPVPGGADGMRALLDRGQPDLDAGFGGKTLEMGQRFVDAMAGYPKLRQHVRIFHPDLQGPMDVCEVLWGSGLFLDIIDAPDVVKAVLTFITDVYVAFMYRWSEIVPASGGTAVHWAMLHRGRVMLRDDSAMNFSPAMFEEFIAPYNQRILDEFGGGADHFCGRGDHYIPVLSRLTGLNAIAMSQPEYNDMEVIFQHTVDKGIQLLGLPRSTAEDALARGRDLHGNVHCW